MTNAFDINFDRRSKMYREYGGWVVQPNFLKENKGEKLTKKGMLPA